MKSIFGYFGLLLFAMCLCVSCKTASTIATGSVRADSIVSVRYVERVIKDTIEVLVPAESVSSVATSDTSEVHTSLASSRAWLDPNGTLHHTIENLPITLPFVIDRVEVVKDSIVFRDRVVATERKVRKNGLSPWTCFCAGFLFCLFLLGSLALTHRR